MRIISGFLGGRRLNAKVAAGIRPTSDRVREALGSLLQARGAFEDACVLDLFAGTGAFGLEALSRGARHVVAIDEQNSALRCLEQNVRDLGVSEQVTRRKLDLFAGPARVLETLAALAPEPFSLIFADPPYRDLVRLGPLLEALGAHTCVAEQALLVIEHARASVLPGLQGLETVGHYAYGDSAITLLARPRQMSEGDDDMSAEASSGIATGPARPSAAIYAGSFDPITNGHLAVIRSGLVAFDHLIISVLTNTAKKPLFSVDERMEFIRDAIGSEAGVEVDRFDDGLLVDYARKRGVRVLLRGLRAIGDFEHELQMANMNRHLAAGIETVFIMANDYFYVSSTLVKEAAALGGNLHGMVPELVEKKLRVKFGR
jgi:pantetheine-phosphate adenylyltransferase